MIERTLGFKVGQLFFPCIEDAQRHELAEIFAGAGMGKADGGLAAETVLKQQEKILDILTTTPTSKVKARKINGGTKRRKKASPEAVNAALQDQDA